MNCLQTIDKKLKVQVKQIAVRWNKIKASVLTTPECAKTIGNANALITNPIVMKMDAS